MRTELQDSLHAISCSIPKVVRLVKKSWKIRMSSGKRKWMPKKQLEEMIREVVKDGPRPAAPTTYYSEE